LTIETERSDPLQAGMMRPVQVVGSYLSPYVRKVLVVLDLKRI
jgi:hypothetical protein